MSDATVSRDRPLSLRHSVALIAGEAVLAAAVYVLAWRLRLPAIDFDARWPDIASYAMWLSATQAVVVAAIALAGGALRSIGPLTIAAFIGPALSALAIWQTAGRDGLPVGIAAGYAWLYWVAGVGWRSAWAIGTTDRRRAGSGPRRDSSLTAVLGHRELLRNLILKDLRLKYRGSFLGFAWSLVNPIVMTSIYAFAFLYVVQVKQPAFVMYVLLGLVAWTYFVTSAAMSTGAIVDGGSLVKGVYFPRSILPLATVLFCLSQYLLTMAVFLPALLVAYGIAPTASMLLFPLVILGQTVFTYGIALALSAGTARFRDVRHFLEIGLQVMFWTTPIVYELAARGDHVEAILRLSPMSPFITLNHQLFYYRTGPDLATTALSVLYVSAAFLGGLALFMRSEEHFAEQC